LIFRSIVDGNLLSRRKDSNFGRVEKEGQKESYQQRRQASAIVRILSRGFVTIQLHNKKDSFLCV
jgi:hypothetical protein